MSIIYFGLIVKSCFDIIHLTGVFYQKILQHILNGNFVYLTFLTLRMSLHAGQYIDDFVNKRKAETVQSEIVGYYPRSKLPFRGI